MLPSFLLSLREGLEAALLIGILLGTLRKIKRAELASTVWYGAGSAVLLSLLIAVILNLFGATLEGAAEEIFEGFAMLLAAAVLTWVIFWLWRNAASMQGKVESDVKMAVLQAGRKPLFLVAFLAVLREGIELALFLTATVAASGQGQTLIGALLGLAASALLGWALFSTTIRLDLNRFFQVTSVLLILFAAGLVAHGVHEFNEVGWIPGVIEHVWDMNFILDEKSFGGEILKALFGYNGNPSLTEVLAYGAYLSAIVFSLRRSASLPAAEQA